jgi:UPF0176 protein
MSKPTLSHRPHSPPPQPMPSLVVTFYKFITLDNPGALQRPLLECCQAQGVKGTILLAHEGINSTLAGPELGVLAALAWLKQDARFEDLTYKSAWTKELPFERLKVKLKAEIVTLGLPEVDPSAQVGTYVAPEAWNDLIQDPEVVLLDTRNAYEVSIGTFQGAQDPHTHSFREFPAYTQQHLDPKVHKKIAMFCTGGIRCEKASSYMLAQGFEQVYHLQGGILSYLEKVPPQESLWQGECFVFDERIAVQHQLEPGTHDMCRGCGHPINQLDKAEVAYVPGISCPYCVEHLTPQKQQRLAEKERQRQLKI